jgi:hypothetical protein
LTTHQRGERLGACRILFEREQPRLERRAVGLGLDLEQIDQRGVEARERLRRRRERGHRWWWRGRSRALLECDDRRDEIVGDDVRCARGEIVVGERRDRSQHRHRSRQDVEIGARDLRLADLRRVEQRFERARDTHGGQHLDDSSRTFDRVRGARDRVELPAVCGVDRVVARLDRGQVRRDLVAEQPEEHRVGH